MKLYELTDTYAELVAQLDECETDDEAAQLWAQLDEIGSSIAEKADNYARFMRNKQSDISALDDEIKRLQKRKKVFSGTCMKMQSIASERRGKSPLKRVGRASLRHIKNRFLSPLH